MNNMKLTGVTLPVEIEGKGCEFLPVSFLDDSANELISKPKLLPSLEVQFPFGPPEIDKTLLASTSMTSEIEAF